MCSTCLFNESRLTRANPDKNSAPNGNYRPPSFVNTDEETLSETLSLRYWNKVFGGTTYF